ncbi:MAG: hypothetical protein Q8T11_14570 [Elusimicrobiota bacterium]|nr:hypothetical protein [Elusimicrobiota bacterium]
MKTALFLLVVLAVPALAAPSAVRISGGKKAEDKLRRFVEQDERLKARLDEAVRREEYYLAEARESDLRDAVSDTHYGDNLRSGLEKSVGERRKDILSGLPGMRAAAAPACRDLVACPNPELALDVADAGQLFDSVRRLVRPWMILQQARGSAVELTPVDGPGDAALSVKVKGLDSQPLIINVSPRLLGGFKVWLERPLYLAALYGHERDAVLRSAR